MFARQGIGDVWRPAVLPSGVRVVATWMLEVALNTEEEWRAVLGTLHATPMLRLWHATQMFHVTSSGLFAVEDL